MAGAARFENLSPGVEPIDGIPFGLLRYVQDGLAGLTASNGRLE